MCGIAGAFVPDGVDGDALAEMNEALVHRGPDEEGYFIDGAVGLAHRRLAIVDPEGGSQPMFNEDRSVAVVFNGEIYNYTDLRSSLSSHTFTSKSDTEVLVHAYEEYGLSFIDHLEGMFAFALWDSNKDRLVLARDPMGIKPLFVAADGASVSFASELPALFDGPVEHGGLDRTGIASYFAFGYVPAPNSVFHNVSKLEPGERVVVQSDGIDRDRYYNPTINATNDDFRTAANRVRELVEQAVRKRLQADVPLGAFLSGGIDSSIVVGVLSEILEEPVKTFSVGFGVERFDERWAAAEVADYHDTDHHEYSVEPSDVRELLPQILESMGQPFADSSILPTTIVSRETSSEVTVALSGDGADELFAGYNKYRGEYYSQYYRTLPRGLRNAVLEPVIDLIPASRDSRTGNIGRKAQKFVRGDEPDIARRQFQWMAITTDSTERALSGISPIETAIEHVRDAQMESRALLPSNRQDDLSLMQTTDTRFALPDGILNKVDRASMLNSLEVRVPLLDRRIYEYTAGLPTKYKITPRSRKKILKSAYKDLLPESILNRDKQGFEVPVGEWFKSELSEDFVETIENAQNTVLDNSAVMEIYGEHREGRTDHANFLWSVYVYAKWRANMERRGILSPEDTVL